MPNKTFLKKSLKASKTKGSLIPAKCNFSLAKISIYTHKNKYAIALSYPRFFIHDSGAEFHAD